MLLSAMTRGSTGTYSFGTANLSPHSRFLIFHRGHRSIRRGSSFFPPFFSVSASLWIGSLDGCGISFPSFSRLVPVRSSGGSGGGQWVSSQFFSSRWLLLTTMALRRCTGRRLRHFSGLRFPSPFSNVGNGFWGASSHSSL